MPNWKFNASLSPKINTESNIMNFYYFIVKLNSSCPTCERYKSEDEQEMNNYIHRSYFPFPLPDKFRTCLGVHNRPIVENRTPRLCARSTILRYHVYTWFDEDCRDGGGGAGDNRRRRRYSRARHASGFRCHNESSFRTCNS